MSHVLISQQRGEGLRLLRIVLGTRHRLVELFLLDETDATRHLGQSRQHVAEELAVMIVEVEHDALAGRRGEQHQCAAHLIDGRELHAPVAQSVGTAAEHVVDTYAPHERVGGEVGLELTIRGTSRQVAHAHDLGIEGMQGDGIEDEPLGQELGVYVLVAAEVLSHVETLLVEHGVVFLAYPHAARAGGGYMYQPCADLQAQIYAAFSTSDVHVLNFCALREMLHDSGTVDDSRQLATDGRHFLDKVFRHVAKDDVKSAPEQFLERTVEIVEQHRAQTTLRLLLSLTADEAVDLASVAVDQVSQHMDAEIAGSTGQQHVAQRLPLALAEVIERITAQHVVDGGIVVVGHLVIARRSVSRHRVTRDEGCQAPGGRIVEHVAVGHMEALLVGGHHNLHHGERRATEFEEVVGGAHLVEL